MKRRVMVIGAIGAGKSSLTHALLGKNTGAKKTQSLLYDDWIVDTPGEYTENPLYYKSIMTTALEVTHVLFIQDATRKHSIFPPGFSSGMNKLIIGVITKCDHKEANIVRATEFLKQAIQTGPIVTTSAHLKLGIEELVCLTQCSTAEEMRDFIAKSTSDQLSYHN